MTGITLGAARKPGQVHAFDRGISFASTTGNNKHQDDPLVPAELAMVRPGEVP